MMTRSHLRPTLCLFLGLIVALSGTALLCAEAPGASAGPFDHAAWDAILYRYVDAGRVDYEKIQREARQDFEGYLKSLEDTPVDRFGSPKEQLVFWINAYNACVFKGVLDHSPLKSVKDVNGFFDRLRYRVGGRPMTLNDIEANTRSFKDWRVHFALVCASSSCPFLRSEAYTGDRLDEQLDAQASQFLTDPSRGLRLDDAQRILWVSKIFKWYAKDFVPDQTVTSGTLLLVLEPYLEPEIGRAHV